MIKKYSKLFALTFLTFFISMLSVNARSMTAEDLGKEILEINPNAGHVYVIGSYAFTSEYALKYDLKDIMLASADSIEVSVENGKAKEDLEDLSETMTIYEIDRTGESEWKLVDNVVGSGTAFNNNNTVDIKYIDYEAVKDRVNTDTLINEAMDKVNETMFEFATEGHDITVTVKPEKGNTNIVVGMASGVIQAFDGIARTENVKEIQFKYGDNVTYTFKKADNEDYGTWFNTNKEAIFGKTEGIVLKDLAGKTFTATIVVEDNAVSQNRNQEEVYTITFVFKESANETLKSKIDEYSDPTGTFDATYDGTGDRVQVKVLKQTSKLSEITGTKIFETFKAILKREDVKSVKLTYEDISQTFDKENDGVYSWLYTNREAILGTTDLDTLVNEMIGKVFTVEITLEDGYLTTEDSSNTVTYYFEFTGDKLKPVEEEEIENYIHKAEMERDDFVSKYTAENKTLTVTVLDSEEDYENVANTGLVDTAVSLLADERVEKVVITYDSNPPFEFTKNMGFEEVKAKAKELLKAMAPNQKLSELDTKSVTIKGVIDQTKGYFLDDPTQTETEEYTVRFEVKKYTVTLDYAEQGTPKKENETMNSGATLEIPEWDEDHKFNGWYEVQEDGSLGTEKVTKVTKDLNLKAKWDTVIKAAEFEELSTQAAEAVTVYGVTVEDNKVTVTFNSEVAEKFVMDYIIDNTHAGGGSGTGLNTAISNFFASEKIGAIAVYVGESKEIITKEEYEAVKGDNSKLQLFAMDVAERVAKGLDMENTELSTMKNSDLVGHGVTFEIIPAEGYAFPDDFNSVYTITVSQAD